MLPLGGLGTAIFIGWVWQTQNAVGEIEKEGLKFSLGGAWSALVKYILPLILAYILVTGLFL